MELVTDKDCANLAWCYSKTDYDYCDVHDGCGGHDGHDARDYFAGYY